MQEIQRSEFYQSETSKHRSKLAPFCAGYGVDIGFGGDPITPNAVRVDFPKPYAYTGELGVQLGGDARHLPWFADEVLDFVYSSHVLEDFDESETELVMREWTRVLRVGGRLILLQPDQQKYLAHCRNTGQGVNPHHAIDRFSLAYVQEVAGRIGGLKTVASSEDIDEYSFYVVLEKTGSASPSIRSAEQTEKELLKLRSEKAELQLQFRLLDGELKKAQAKLEQYRSHPGFKFLKAIYKLPRKLAGK